MKKSIFKISGLFLTFVFCFSSNAANSQNLKSTKTARKEGRKVELAKDYQGLGTYLERRRFVFEMESQLKPNGTKTGLNPMLNFIMVDSASCVLESESEIFSNFFKKVSKVGGRIDSWKLAKDNKNLSYYLQFIMNSDDGRYQVSMSIYPDKSASGNLNSSNINFAFTGRIVTH